MIVTGWAALCDITQTDVTGAWRRSFSPRARGLSCTPSDCTGGTKNGWLANLRFIIFLNVPYMKIRLLVWDGGPQLVYEN